MKVSVLITTYNQEGFIAQAVGSVLTQKVNFPYEVVIGEDASTDQTREIVEAFQRKYPDKLRLLLRDPAAAARDRTAGIGGKGSFVNCLAACSGDYVALLDGDDYWTNPNKLQRQADFLDQHADFAISFHNAKAVYGNGSTESANRTWKHPDVFSLEDLLEMNFIPACSTMFRRGLFGELPAWFQHVVTGDWALHLLNAQYGKIGCINEVMAAYRVHPEGMWPSLGAIRQRLEMIRTLNYVNAELGFRYRKQISAAKAVWYYQLARISFREGNRLKAALFLWRCLWLRGFKRGR
jgi:glycosyltransferase involved in cell wall biosynthesis